MKKIVKLLFAGMMVAGITLLPSLNANAKISAYLVKDKATGIVYQYDKKALEDAVLNYRLIGKDSLYEDFSTRVSKNDFYSFYDDIKKYVEYNSIIKAFMDARNNNKAFILDNFTMSPQAETVKDMPNSVKVVNVTGGQLKIEDKIVEDDFGVISIE